MSSPSLSPPPFSGLYHFSVLEDIAIGDPIGRVKANDLDIGENAKSFYDIIEGDGMDIFEIAADSQTQDGILRLRKVNGSKIKYCVCGPWCCLSNTIKHLHASVQDMSMGF